MKWLLGFLAKFLTGIFKDWRRDNALTEKGRVEQELEQEKATVEVLARNAEGIQEADELPEEERRRRLTDGS